MTNKSTSKKDVPADINSEFKGSPITLLQQRGIEAEVFIPLVRKLEKELGQEKAHELAKETIYEIAREQGKQFSRLIQKTDLNGFRTIKDTWSAAGSDLDIEVIQDNDDSFHFNVTGCRFAQLFKSLGATDLGAIFSCGRDFALSQGYSEDIELNRTQTIMEGASFCDFRYSWKPTHK
jgi:predicted hydrocarbon binding protein